MEQLMLNQFKRLPEHLQIEALHYIQYLLSIKEQEADVTSSGALTDSVAKEERKRRVAVVSRFKGSLKKALPGYQPDKHEWYRQ